ncbi:MAG: type II toxin-antitoxin system VapC family toxin [Gammaproteobacteria bacterium]|nr:type II toxin-antitoxin system VapC family toxin [Gammaproteobacteria bacterium]
MKALFDSVILIDYLNGIAAAREEIARYDDLLVSPINWMEVMVGVSGPDEPIVRRFLGRFTQIVVDQDVAEIAVELRRRHRLRLPDAIVWASARHAGALLVTRDTRDFPDNDPGVRVPYRL